MDAAIKTISGLFALAAFGIAIIAGLAAQNQPATVLSNALICMLLCRIAGGLFGSIAVRMTTNDLNAFRAANPIPDLSAAVSTIAGDSDQGASEVTESTKSSQSTHNG